MTSNWRPIAGVKRADLPGTLVVWIVGGTEHSGMNWRREGSAIVTLNNAGPFGFDPDGLRAARKRLDMQWIDEISLWQPLPPPPGEQAAEVAGEEQGFPASSTERNTSLPARGEVIEECARIADEHAKRRQALAHEFIRNPALFTEQESARVTAVSIATDIRSLPKDRG